eukprot:6177268-Pleurochrysis_carterae.AAC.1
MLWLENDILAVVSGSGFVRLVKYDREVRRELELWQHTRRTRCRRVYAADALPPRTRMHAHARGDAQPRARTMAHAYAFTA